MGRGVVIQASPFSWEQIGLHNAHSPINSCYPPARCWGCRAFALGAETPFRSGRSDVLVAEDGRKVEAGDRANEPLRKLLSIGPL